MRSRSYRPRVLIITALVLTIGLSGLCLWAWFSLPAQIQAKFNDFQLVTLVMIGVVALGAVWAMAASTVRIRAEGLRIRNGFSVTTVVWNDIRAIRFRHGEPWASVTLNRVDADGAYLRRSMMGLQRVDGARTVAAVDELTRVCREQRKQTAEHG